MDYQKMWRADTYYRSIEIADVADNAPVGEWLTPMMGDGSYAYFKSKQEAKNALIVALLEEISDIRSDIDKLSKDEE